MARRSNPRGRRVASANANRRLSALPSFLDPVAPLQRVEDRRSFHPEGVLRPLRGLKSWRHRLTHPLSPLNPVKRVSMASRRQAVRLSSIGFANPVRLMICARRKIRKEVLLALGRGGGAHRKPRRGPYTGVRC